MIESEANRVSVLFLHDIHIKKLDQHMETPRRLVMYILY